MRAARLLLLLFISSPVHGQLNPRTPSQKRVALERWIPWTIQPNPDAQKAFRVNVTVNGHESNMPVDTGSTGVLMAAQDLGYHNDADVKASCQGGCEPAFEYLSSSRRYYQGYWLPSTLTFTSMAGNDMISQVPILAVTENGTCSSFNGTCTKATSQPMPCCIRYMGIGFGRWGPEQPDATVDKNPALNVELADNLHQGYIVSDQGLMLGVEPDDYVGTYKWTNLLANNYTNTSRPTSRPEWAMTPMQVQVAGGDTFDGTALLDTGIDFAYLAVPHAATDGVITEVGGRTVVRDGVEIAIKLGRDGELASYSFRVGDSGDEPRLAPKQVRLSKMHDGASFVNTGRYFYNGFSVVFDQDAGVVGIKVNSNTDRLRDATKAGTGPQQEDQKPVYYGEL